MGRSNLGALCAIRRRSECSAQGGEGERDKAVADDPQSSDRTLHAGVTAEAEGWDLSGDLTRMPLIAVLQFLELSRHTGNLVVTSSEGRVCQCTLRVGAVIEATCRHLRGREALLTVLGWKAGRFAFSACEQSEEAEEAIAISPVIMERVRLEDELERASAGWLGEGTSLALQNPHEVPVDPLGCGADSVMAAIAARPGVTLGELERSLALAPIRIRLSLAWLSQTDRLRSADAVHKHREELGVPQPEGWYAALLRRYPGGLRVVFCAAAEQGAHEVIGATTQFAKAMDSGPAWMSLGADGVAMARVRPRQGGLLSLACFPMTRAHAEAFRTFAATADLVLFCDTASAEVQAVWRAMVDPGKPTGEVRCAAGEGALVGAFRRFAEGLAAGGGVSA